MILTYCYRIKPSAEQEVVMLHTLELLRRHWNYALGKRLDWLRRTRCQIDRCSLFCEPIGDIPIKVDYYTQQSDLKETKVLFPEYKDIWAEAQQVNLQRLKKAWERWLIPDKKGHQFGDKKIGERSRCSTPSETRSDQRAPSNTINSQHPQITKKESAIGEEKERETPANMTNHQHRQISKKESPFLSKPDLAPLFSKPCLGKRGGRPRFKKSGELRSFVYPRINCPKAGATLNDGILKLSKIGEMPVIMHRPLPDGFVLKTCAIVKKADGWYCNISMQDETIPESLPLDEIKTSTGIDVGCEKFLTTASGISVSVPQFYRKAQSKLARAQRKLARQDKGSKGWEKQKNAIALLHLHVARCRKEFHYSVAHWLCKQYDLIAYEHLNIRGLARTRLAKSILDCAWGAFLQILGAVAVKRGKLTVECDARGTSIECSSCGERVKKDLSVRVHSCPSCRLEIDRDWNSGINLLKRGLETVGLPFPGCGGLVDAHPLRQQFLVVKLEAPVITAQAV